MKRIVFPAVFSILRSLFRITLFPPFADTRSYFLAIFLSVIAVVSACTFTISPIFFTASFEVSFTIFEIFLPVMLALFFGVFVGHGGRKYITNFNQYLVVQEA
jgi:hypothetical protein